MSNEILKIKHHIDHHTWRISLHKRIVDRDQSGYPWRKKNEPFVCHLVLAPRRFGLEYRKKVDDHTETGANSETKWGMWSQRHISDLRMPGTAPSGLSASLLMLRFPHRPEGPSCSYAQPIAAVMVNDKREHPPYPSVLVGQSQLWETDCRTNRANCFNFTGKARDGRWTQTQANMKRCLTAS